MNTEERVKHAENRIKELQLLINHWNVSMNSSHNRDLKLVEDKIEMSKESIAA